MPSGKTLKLVLLEVLQFAALSVPVFVVMERFAALMRDIEARNETAYWLVVATSVAYVTSVTLLVWVPLKFLILKRRRFSTRIRQWRPAALAHVILCTLPCFAVLLAGSKVQVDRGLRRDLFTELPPSLVLFCLICVDVIERIRPFNLTGKDRGGLDADFDARSSGLTHLEQVTTVSAQLYLDRAQDAAPAPGPPPEAPNGAPSGGRYDPADSPGPSALTSRAPSVAYLYSSTPRSRSHSGPLGFLWARDGRAEVVLDGFLFWLDTAEMLRAAGQPEVFYSGWAFAVFALAFLSCLRLVVSPRDPLLCSAGFALHDLPFFVLRAALIVVFGYVTPVLYAAKNALACLAYVYFTFLCRLRIFRRRSMF